MSNTISTDKQNKKIDNIQDNLNQIDNYLNQKDDSTSYTQAREKVVGTLVGTIAGAYLPKLFDRVLPNKISPIVSPLLGIGMGIGIGYAIEAALKKDVIKIDPNTNLNTNKTNEKIFIKSKYNDNTTTTTNKKDDETINTTTKVIYKNTSKTSLDIYQENINITQGNITNIKFGNQNNFYGKIQQDNNNYIYQKNSDSKIRSINNSDKININLGDQESTKKYQKRVSQNLNNKLDITITNSYIQNENNPTNINKIKINDNFAARSYNQDHNFSWDDSNTYINLNENEEYSSFKYFHNKTNFQLGGPSFYLNAGIFKGEIRMNRVSTYAMNVNFNDYLSSSRILNMFLTISSRRNYDKLKKLCLGSQKYSISSTFKYIYSRESYFLKDTKIGLNRPNSTISVYKSPTKNPAKEKIVVYNMQVNHLASTN